MNITSYENDAINIVNSLIDEFNVKFIEYGINVKTAFNKSDISTVNYQSEIEILFIKQKHVIDVIEFLVIKDGLPFSDLTNTKLWIRESIEDVLSKYVQSVQKYT